MQSHSPASRRRLRGFTMTEMVVALAILSLTMAGVVAFTFQSLNVFAYDSGRLLVNHDIRKFTGDMVSDAVYASYFQIYNSFTDRTGPQGDRGTGDFLLLVTTEFDSTSKLTVIKELVGYYRDATGSTPGPVRRLDVVLSPPYAVIGSVTNTSLTPPNYTMPDLLTTYAPTSGSSTNPIVIQLAQGLADANNRMFYNVKDHSAMIRSQIDEQGKMVRKAVNTYNFTVSPRG